MIRVVAIFFMSTLAGCSTYLENEASVEFQPVIPQENSYMRPTGGSIYLPGATGLFAVEKRASKVGDVLTVALNESFQAKKSQSASAAKKESTTAELPGFLDFIVDPSFASDQAFAGSGAAEQSNSFTGLVTVSVVQVFQNGNLQLLGQKKLTLNNGDEYVRVSGIVRQDDISPRNVVNSNRLANAEITYIGAGDVADTAKRGLFPRLLSAINPV